MDNRLVTCAMLCEGDKIADIGTDHAYLPCYMVKNSLAKSALACDCAEKPLENARNHIKLMRLEDKISTILSNGLTKVPLQDVTDIVIAGMGGQLIAEILSNCVQIRENVPRINLVLQPMTKWDYLRNWLYHNNFKIKKELACCQGKFVYSVMQAEYTGEIPDYECSPEYLYTGFVSPQTPQGRAYFLRQIDRLERAGKGMLNSADDCKEGEKLLHTAKNLRDILQSS